MGLGEDEGRRLNAYLLVDTRQANAVLATFGVGLRIDFFVRALAIKHDSLTNDALLRKVETVDAGAHLFGHLEEREGFSWAENDGLLTLVRALGENELWR